MALRKNKLISFSQKMKGYHNYDLNICFEVNKANLKIIVTNEILIEHFSKGTINESWIQSTYEIHRLFSKILPVGYTKNDDLEFKNGKYFINSCLKFKKYKIALFVWFRLFLIKPISRFHLSLLKKIITRC